MTYEHQPPAAKTHRGKHALWRRGLEPRETLRRACSHYTIARSALYHRGELGRKPLLLNISATCKCPLCAIRKCPRLATQDQILFAPPTGGVLVQPVDCQPILRPDRSILVKICGPR